MAFAAIFVPNFTLQAIVRSEPELQAQPMVVIGGEQSTYRAIAFNRQAERLGVAVGMTKAAVEQFRGVKIRHRSKTQEEAAHLALLDAAWSISSRVEDAAPDTLLLDLSGLTRLFGTRKRLHTGSFLAFPNWEWMFTLPYPKTWKQRGSLPALCLGRR